MSVEYENLEIELSRCCCGEREVRILESPVDRPRARLRISDDELAKLRDSVDRYDGLLFDRSREGRAGALTLARGIGRRLFDLLSPDEVGSSLRESLLLLDLEREERDVGRRLRFSFGQGEHYDPALATLPWELICDPRTGDRFLGGEPMTQVARHLEINRKIKPLAVAAPLKILAVLASPTDQPRVDLERQEASLRRAAKAPSSSLELHVLKRPTLANLVDILAVHQAKGRPFHVLHFLGHGELTAEGHGALYFEGEDRSQQVVRSQVLATQLSAFRDLRLVVLATCSGAKLPRFAGHNPFTGSASALIAANIPAVVAMQFSISQRAAAWFTEAFYAELANRSPLENAVAQGRLKILAEDVDSLEWATPVLFLRCPDGVVFRPAPPASTTEAEHTSGTKVQESVADVEVGCNARITGIEGAASLPGKSNVDIEIRNSKITGDLDVTGTRA